MLAVTWICTTERIDCETWLKSSSNQKVNIHGVIWDACLSCDACLHTLIRQTVVSLFSLLSFPYYWNYNDSCCVFISNFLLWLQIKSFHWQVVMWSSYRKCWCNSVQRPTDNRLFRLNWVIFLWFLFFLWVYQFIMLQERTFKRGCGHKWILE